MSWLWSNETTEQAQIVVSALQGELDERELKIQALEAALRREQQDFQQLLQSEIRELEAKRSRIAHELEEVDALIADKQQLLHKGKSSSNSAKTTKKKKPASVNGNSVTASATATTSAAAIAAAIVPLEKKASEKKKKSKKLKATGDAPPATTTKRVLPLGEHLLKIAAVEPNVTFIIQRSTNANTVVYAAQLQRNNASTTKALDPTKPIDVYWLMYEKPGTPREDLNMLERNTAYGVSCAPIATAPGTFHMQLSSLKDRECILLVDDVSGAVQARTTINGQRNCVLCRVFVQMTTGWVPTVDYVELFGFDASTLEVVYEKKSNK